MVWRAVLVEDNDCFAKLTIILQPSTSKLTLDDQGLGWGLLLTQLQQ